MENKMTKNGIVMHVRWLSVVACLGLVGGGCLQLETSIRLHEDGSATVTERIGFSRRLLDMTRNASAALQLEPMLTREAALERMERMGKGIQLVRHEVREGENGARESLSVYKIGYLGDFVYPSPFMNSRDQIHTIHANIRPNTSWGEWSRRGVEPGMLIVSFSEGKHPPRPAEPAKETAKATTAAGTPKPDKSPTLSNDPDGAQFYRDLAPIFRDMLDGFLLRVTFESYAPIGNYAGVPLRDNRTRPLSCDLIHVTSDDLDKHGFEFFENEEIMLDLLRGRLNRNPHAPDYSHFLRDHLGGAEGNATLPLLNQTGGASFMIQPSRPLFDRFFTGKELHWGENYRNRQHRGTKQARFEDIGWTGK
jgi:hypothetical protein